MWYHESRPITFTLVVDNFGVKYVNKDNVDHLIASIKQDYMLTEDWTGNLYCGTQLNWDYAGQTVDISMPGYIKRNCRSTGTSYQEKFRDALTHWSQKNLGQKPKHLSPRITCQSLTKRELSGSKICEEHFVLCASSRHDCFNGAQHHCS